MNGFEFHRQRLRCAQVPPYVAFLLLQEVATRVGAHLVQPPPLEGYRLVIPSSAMTSSGDNHNWLATTSNDNVNGVVALGGEHMQVNASVAVALAAEWESQYAAAAAAAWLSSSAAEAAEAVAAAAGRPVALAHGGPDPEAAAARAVAVQSLKLPAEYAMGLRTVQWAGRSQVCPPGLGGVGEQREAGGIIMCND